MKSLDDIKGFKEKTGLSNYKVLSEYNVENLLTPWAIIEKLKMRVNFTLLLFQPLACLIFQM